MPFHIFTFSYNNSSGCLIAVLLYYRCSCAAPDEINPRELEALFSVGKGMGYLFSLINRYLPSPYIFLPFDSLLMTHNVHTHTLTRTLMCDLNGFSF